MQSTSLLPKYLLTTAVVCAAAVGFTALGHYAAFGEGAAEPPGLAAQVEAATASTRALADELATDARPGDAPDLAARIRRGRQLTGAELVVFLGPHGTPRATSGDDALLGRVTALAPGQSGAADGLVVVRLPVVAGGAAGSVAQVFATRPGSGAAPPPDGFVDSLAQRFGRPGLIASGVVAVVAALAGIAGLVGFARRQVRDLRSLITSAGHLGEGRYDLPIATSRRDEIGALAASLDRLRETLRTATISRDYLDMVLASMSEALFVTSPDGTIVRANPAAGRLLEQPADGLIGRRLDDFVGEDRRRHFRLVDSAGRSVETNLATGSGQQVPVSYTVAEIHDSNPAFRGYVIAARNITERKVAEQRIRYLARIDALTKVPNRMQFQHLLQRAVARAARSGHGCALVYLDVDRFKDINDIYGHAGGDACLETLAERLTRALPEGTLIGRFAGDEFGVLLELPDGDGDPRTEVAARTRGMLREIAGMIPFQGHQVYMTASAGVALYPGDASDVIALIRNADAALFQAKRAGGDGFEFYSAEMNAEATDRLMLKSRLRRSYERDELRVQYQPKVDLKTGRVAGAEALIRWELSDRGIVLPAQFIPLAEESNLILDIGEWVLDRVCRDVHRWQARLLFPGRISVNLSLKQLRQPNFTQRVGAIFRRHSVPPASLELEITETTLMENPERTVRILDELYAMGLTLAIDDFGTGYSSLSALQKFPISTLKIDQSFVRDAATDPDDASIITAIIQMGHSLNMDVVAEGVENEAQLAFLRQARCDFVQGLLFGQPMAADEFLQLIETQRRGTPAYATLFA